MKAADRIFFLDTGQFPATVLFCAGVERAEIIKALKTYKKAPYWFKAIEHDFTIIEDGVWGKALKRIVGERTLFYIIIKDKFKFTDGDYARLAHECLHICQFLLPELLDRDREFECEAYLHTHLMMQCLECIRRKK